jgi:hypothetical protein
LTFGLGIIIIQGVSRRKSLAGVNIMYIPAGPNPGISVRSAREGKYVLLVLSKSMTDKLMPTDIYHQANCPK